MSEVIVPTTDDMSPDGVRIAVEWDKWEIGMSVFVPALYVNAAISQFEAQARKRGWGIVTQVRVESGYLGVRAWRIEKIKDD